MNALRTDAKDLARELERYSDELSEAAYEVKSASANLLILADHYRERNRLEIEENLRELKQAVDAFERTFRQAPPARVGLGAGSGAGAR